jgi:hypothetical protein
MVLVLVHLGLLVPIVVANHVQMRAPVEEHVIVMELALAQLITEVHQIVHVKPQLLEAVQTGI